MRVPELLLSFSCVLLLALPGLPNARSQDARSDPMPLVVFDEAFDLGSLMTHEATASLVDVDGEDKGIKVVFQASDKYPEVQFSPEEGSWELSQYGGIRAAIINTGSHTVKVAIRADNEGTAAQKRWNTGSGEIEPGATKLVEVMFGEAEGKMAAYPLDTAKVVAAHVFVTQPKEEASLVVKSVEAFGASSKSATSAEATGGETPSSRPVPVKTKPSDPVLFGFDRPDVLSRISGQDSKFKVIDANGGKALRVDFGTAKPYPSVALKPAEGSWNLERFISIEFSITNHGDESLQLASRVDNPGATGKSNSNGGKATIDPGETGTLSVEFDRYFADDLRQKLTGMPYTPWGSRGERGSRMDPANVVQVSLYANTPARPRSFTINTIKAVGDFDPASQVIPEPFFPFIDRFGQYIHKDWLNKVKTEDDFVKAKAEEQASIDKFPRPPNWNVYGGWADGPQLEKKGHFYTTKREGKWFLVDPEGRLFFSLGMDVVQVGQGGTPIDKREGWFADAPWEKEEQYKEFLGRVKEVKHGAYKGSSPQAYNFYAANLKRKYGADWEQTWQGLMPQRLMNWGFNTIGNWSDPKILKEGKIPYTHWVFHSARKLPWQENTRNPIADPFDPTFEENVRMGAEKMTSGTIDDPYCIGYFVDNELSWRDDVFQGKAAMAGNASNPAKVELIKDLTAKYRDIEKLNAAWKTSFASWEAMTGDKALPETGEGKQDLREFTAKIAHKYFGTVSRVMKEVAPNKLYLGSRFADHNPQVVEIAAEYCDVVSFNIYRESVKSWKPAVPIDKPVIIGEFHFGATDRGVFGPGLVKAKSAQNRAEMFLNYVVGAAKNPQIVGAHWFALVDEPTTGRASDGENYNIGFLSIADVPYQEMIDASRKAANEIYAVHSK